MAEIIKFDDIDPEEVEVEQAAPAQEVIPFDAIDPSEIEVESTDSGSDMTAVGATIMGGLQEVTLGYADEMSATAEAFVTGNSYDQVLDEVRSRYATAKEEFPAAFTGGQITGGFLGAGKILSAVKGVKKMVAASTAIGFVEGLGKSEEDDIEHMVSDGLTGAAWGAAGGTVGEVADAVLRKGGSVLKEQATTFIEKAMGAFNPSSQRLMRQTLQAKGTNPEQFFDRVTKLKDTTGKNLLANNKSRGQLLDSLESTRLKTGADIGTIYKEVSEEVGQNIDPKLFAFSIKQRLKQNPEIQQIISNPEFKTQMGRLESVNAIIDNVSQRTTNMTVTDVQGFKQQIVKEFSEGTGNYYKLTDVEMVFERSVNDFLQTTVESYSKNGQALKALKSLNKDYETIKTFGKFVDKSMAADQGGALGKVAKSLMYAAPAVLGGSLAGPTGAGAAVLIGAGLKTAAKNPTVAKKLASSLNKVAGSLEKTADSNMVKRLSVAAGLSMTGFEEQIEEEALRVDGFLPTQEEKDFHRQKIKTSGAPARLQVKWMVQVNSDGRMPSYEDMNDPEINKPFMRQYQARPRNEDGRKQ